MTREDKDEILYREWAWSTARPFSERGAWHASRKALRAELHALLIENSHDAKAAFAAMLEATRPEPENTNAER